MSRSSNPAVAWWESATEMNRRYMDAMRGSMTASDRMVDAWLDSVGESTDQERLDESANAVVEAYDIWMRAAQNTLEETADALEGEDVPTERVRDIWLNAANRAFKNAMETTAFAAATGESVDDGLRYRQQLDDLTEETIHGWGLPTEGDIREVGERLVELERRQHEVERRLRRVLDALESEE